MKGILHLGLLHRESVCRHRWRSGVCQKCGEECDHREAYDTAGAGFVWEIPEWNILCGTCHTHLGYSVNPQDRTRWLRG